MRRPRNEYLEIAEKLAQSPGPGDLQAASLAIRELLDERAKLTQKLVQRRPLYPIPPKLPVTKKPWWRLFGG